MTTELIDISMPPSGDTPAWPGSPGITTSVLTSMAAGDDANGSRLDMDVHCGTHVDAPRHFIADGAPIEAVGLDPSVGPSWVADLTGRRTITAADLDAAQIPTDTERLLLKTDNSLEGRFNTAPFQDDYVALAKDAASWVVEHGLKLVGTDYLSIQAFSDPPDTHQILLGARVTILEGLRLRHVEQGSWTLVCLPLKLIGIEAAPARAVLFPEARHGS